MRWSIRRSKRARSHRRAAGAGAWRILQIFLMVPSQDPHRTNAGYLPNGPRRGRNVRYRDRPVCFEGPLHSSLKNCDFPRGRGTVRHESSLSLILTSALLLGATTWPLPDSAKATKKKPNHASSHKSHSSTHHQQHRLPPRQQRQLRFENPEQRVVQAEPLRADRGVLTWLLARAFSFVPACVGSGPESPQPVCWPKNDPLARRSWISPSPTLLPPDSPIPRRRFFPLSPTPARSGMSRPPRGCRPRVPRYPRITRDT